MYSYMYTCTQQCVRLCVSLMVGFDLMPSFHLFFQLQLKYPVISIFSRCCTMHTCFTSLESFLELLHHFRYCHFTMPLCKQNITLGDLYKVQQRMHFRQFQCCHFLDSVNETKILCLCRSSEAGPSVYKDATYITTILFFHWWLMPY